MKTINITAIDQVGKIYNHVSHGLFKIDEIRFDKDKLALVVPLLVLRHDKRIKWEVRKIMNFTEHEKWMAPVMAAELIFKGVVNFSIERDDDGDDQGYYISRSGHNLFSTEYEGDQLVARCGHATIRLNVTSYNIECVISDTVVDEIEMGDTTFGCALIFVVLLLLVITILVTGVMLF